MAPKDPNVQLSKFLSLVLRHQPETIGVSLDPAGWIEVDVLLDACGRHGKSITRDKLVELVATSNKQRFALSEDGSRIRANQGHSVSVELGYQPMEPPAELFHGTATRHLASIHEQGLLRGSRHHVHLSGDRDTAIKVGQRHGKPAVLIVQAARMYAAGHVFFVSENHVWLTEYVPVAYLEFPA